MIVILDNIRSNHNVGSIFRTADAAGVSRIFLCGITPGPLDKWGRENIALTKVALSGDSNIPWEHIKNTQQIMDKFRINGYTLYAIEQDKNSQSLFAIDKKTLPQWDKIALVVGNEISGMSPETLARADHTIEIPMFGKKESLNVSVAFGIASYWLRGAISNK